VLTPLSPASNYINLHPRNKHHESGWQRRKKKEEKSKTMKRRGEGRGRSERPPCQTLSFFSSLCSFVGWWCSGEQEERARERASHLPDPLYCLLSFSKGTLPAVLYIGLPPLNSVIAETSMSNTPHRKQRGGGRISRSSESTLSPGSERSRLQRVRAPCRPLCCPTD
jgi:hypothetical protein